MGMGRILLFTLTCWQWLSLHLRNVAYTLLYYYKLEKVRGVLSKGTSGYRMPGILNLLSQVHEVGILPVRPRCPIFRWRATMNLLRPMFRVLIRSLKFWKGPTDALGFMNVVVLYRNHRNASATLVAIFRVMKIRVQICIAFLFSSSWRWPHEWPKHACDYSVINYIKKSKCIWRFP
jgi:hypothetical protein